MNQRCAGLRLAGLLLLVLLVTRIAGAATFGTVVPIGGHAADIALDEKRGVLYIANFTASQIDVMSLRTNTIERSINVMKQPSALALSRDGKWLVITHYGEWGADATRSSAVTVYNLDEASRREFFLGSGPLGVAFGFDDRAFIVTTKEFLRLDPLTGHIARVASVADVVTQTLPVPLATFPPDITKATATASADGRHIFVFAETLIFHYDALAEYVSALWYSAQPALGPRTLSVSDDGSYFAAGWWLMDPGASSSSSYIKGTFAKWSFANWSLSNSSGDLQFGLPSGEYEAGSHVIDSKAGLVYAQVPKDRNDLTLQIAAADNLERLERINLRENLAGRGLLDSARQTVYSISDSGVTVLPVGRLNSLPRVRPERSTMVFRNNGCSRQLQTQDITILDPGGNNTPFEIESRHPGIRISQPYGTTPAVVQVTIDPGAFSVRGTDRGFIEVRSTVAVNVIDPIQVFVNNREPDQRGTLVSIPGALVDMLPDPVRDRTYVLRQDTNEVLVFNNANLKQIAAFRTGTTPMQMAITNDGRYLLVANDGSQMASVFDLTTMQADRPIRFPFSHYPRSIAVSGNAILAVSRVVGEGSPAMIDRIDMGMRMATTLPTLGVYKNSIHVDSVLAASPNGSSVLVAMPDGNVMLYDANKDTFIASRKLPTTLSGSYAASNYNRFAVDKYILNSALVPENPLDRSGSSSGMFFVDQTAFWTNSPASSAPGTIARLDMTRPAAMLATNLTESPVLPGSGTFIRSLAPLPNRSAILSLSRTGLTVLPWNYDAAFAPPRIERVVSAADRSDSLAPGGLITIFGTNLSPFDVSTADPTVADALPEACLTVNGAAAPIIFASSTRINAQLPFNADGTTTLILRTPGGTSDSFRLRLAPAAPTVFRSGTAGPETGIPAVVRAVNNDLVTLSNPIHPGDDIIVYATGLGRTNPEIPPGMPAPQEPLARAVVTPQLQLGGIDLNVYYAGLTPGLVGVYQINALVPRNVPTGFDIPMTIRQDSQTTSLNVRVVR